MNVLIVTFLAPYSPSGVVTYYKSLAADLRQRGMGVTVVQTTDTPYISNKLLNILGHVMNRLGRVSRVFYAEFGYFVRLYLGARQHRQVGFDVIHAQDVRSAVAAYLALGKQVPVVLTCHFNDDPVTELVAADPMPAVFVKLLTRWYTWLFGQINNYVFVSSYAYEKSKHLLPKQVNKAIIYNTVDSTLAQQVLAHSPELLDASTLLISNVGYIDERKNQQLLIETASELRRRGITDFVIKLIGDGPKRADYEQLVEKLGVADQVKFLGRRSDPWRLVAQTHLYIHTALNDNCPYAILEAFAVHTPVLALPVGGIPELLPPQAGPLRGTSPANIADQIVPYFDAARRQQLAAAQTAFSAKKFNRETALTTLLIFYGQCIGQNEQLTVTRYLQPIAAAS